MRAVIGLAIVVSFSSVALAGKTPSCQGIVKTAHIGYEVEQEKCQGAAVYTGEGCTKVRHDVAPMSKSWGEQTQFDFFVIEQDLFKKVAKGKGLALILELFDRQGNSVWSQTHNQWQTWQIPGETMIYQKLINFNARQAINPTIDKLMQLYHNQQKNKRRQLSERLPQKLMVRLLDSDQRVVCSYRFGVDTPADH